MIFLTELVLSRSLLQVIGYNLGLYGGDVPSVILSIAYVVQWPLVSFLLARVIIYLIDRRRVPFGFCRKCRYDLRGAQGSNCPECGEPRLRSTTTQATTTLTP
ncbi:MAG: hypothetical protein H6818_21705 [Phycisphaerales bacterium]|nr:hypothetical protein [Phycisphaerales bacterium]MCB9862407.1 hypothetical protein [Phycisphaerales bacterium]